MKILGIITIMLCAVGCTVPKGESSLKEVMKDKFLVGVAINKQQAAEIDIKGDSLIKKHFNSIVAENCMKCEVIHPEKEKYDFAASDTFVGFGEKYGMFMIGHCLIWHSQLAPWFCVDSLGNNVSPEELKERMRNHIYTIMGRYKGRIQGWDVLNEAVSDDGSWRKSKFHEILGEEYITLSFQYAHEADPDAELYYNDYGMAQEGRRAGVIRLLEMLKSRNLRIDGVGMQGHIGMDYPDFGEFEKSIEAFSKTGVKVMVTELDMTAIPAVNTSADVSEREEYKEELNPYPDGLPDSVSQLWNKRMGDFMDMMIRHKDQISRVTVWGLMDGDSWRNYWPIEGRKDYPLFFNRNYEPKPFLKRLLESKK